MDTFVNTILILTLSFSINTVTWASNKSGTYEVYRYISPEGRVIFSSEKKNDSYIKLRRIPEGWVPESELSLYQGGKKKNPRKAYSPFIRDAAERHQLPYYLIHAVITIESAYNHRALSPKGAQGLMQLMPATAERFEVRDPFNARQNIEGGTRFLRYLLKLLDCNLSLALAGYNAGENAVIRYNNSIPPFKETQNYVKKVLQTYRKYRFSSPPY